MNNARIKVPIFKERQNRIFKYLKEAAMCIPFLKNSKKTGIVDLGITTLIGRNWQHFPLTTRVQKVQNIVENLKIRYFIPRATLSDGQVP